MGAWLVCGAGCGTLPLACACRAHGCHAARTTSWHSARLASVPGPIVGEGADWDVGTPEVIAPQPVATIHEMEIALWHVWESRGGDHHAHRPRSRGPRCRGDKDMSAYGFKVTLLCLARLPGKA